MAESFHGLWVDADGWRGRLIDRRMRLAVRVCNVKPVWIRAVSGLVCTLVAAARGDGHPARLFERCCNVTEDEVVVARMQGEGS